MQLRVATFRVVETVILENSVSSPAENRWFWQTKKAKGFAPRTPEIDENDSNGGCHSGKITVCQKHRFDNPDAWLPLNKESDSLLSIFERWSYLGTINSNAPNALSARLK